VELRLLVLRDALEEQGFSEAEINVHVEEERKAAETEAAAGEGRPRAQGEGYDARVMLFKLPGQEEGRMMIIFVCLSSYYSVLSIAFCCSFLQLR